MLFSYNVSKTSKRKRSKSPSNTAIQKHLELIEKYILDQRTRSPESTYSRHSRTSSPKRAHSSSRESEANYRRARSPPQEEVTHQRRRRTPSPQPSNSQQNRKSRACSPSQKRTHSSSTSEGEYSFDSLQETTNKPEEQENILSLHLEPEILKSLGEDVTSKILEGPNIHSSLAVIWNKILIFIQVLLLNAEVAAVLNSATSKKDPGLCCQSV